MKKSLACFLVMGILLSSFPGLASQTNASQGYIYESAMDCVLFEEYEEALALFEQLGAFADSANWKSYCAGMVAIRKAGELEKQGYIAEAKDEIQRAMQLFEFLSPIDFNQNSKRLYTYCLARTYELSRMDQKALDLFSELIGVEDSGERYDRLLHGIPLPTQAPSHEVPPVLHPIAAHVNETISTYLGPGPKYMVQEIVKVNKKTKLGICGKESSYYLIEVQTKKGLIRCWAPAHLIQRDESASEPRVGAKNKKRSCSLLETAQAYYGPGEQYSAADTLIEKGTKVTAYEAEGLYTMIECSLANQEKPVRVWVRTECLSR